MAKFARVSSAGTVRTIAPGAIPCNAPGRAVEATEATQVYWFALGHDDGDLGATYLKLGSPSQRVNRQFWLGQISSILDFVCTRTVSSLTRRRLTTTRSHFMHWVHTQGSIQIKKMLLALCKTGIYFLSAFARAASNRRQDDREFPEGLKTVPLRFQFLDEVVEEEPPSSLELSSPSVGIISQRFLGPARCQILDLGAPEQSNMAFFSGIPCKFYIEDLYRSFIAPKQGRKNESDDDDGDDAGIAGALSYEDTARFDLVLGWDLFSYMERSAIELLMAHVAGSCHAGTLLFLTFATGARIPSVPARITMTHDGRLCYRSTIDGRSISNPRLSPTALERMMPGFRLLHSFLLGEGMQEFLFSFH